MTFFDYEILIPLFAFLILVASAYKNAETNKAKIFATIITIVGIIGLFINIGNNIKNTLKAKQHKEKIDHLQEEITTCNQKNDSLIKTSDSLLTISKFTQAEFERINIPMYSDWINLNTEDQIPFNGIFEQGMKIKIYQCNCFGAVELNHNNKPITIRENSSGNWETIISETGKENETFLINKGMSACGFRFEIFNSNNPIKLENKIELAKFTGNKNQREPTYHACTIEEVDLDGSWQLIQRYTECENKSDWSNNLIVYYNLEKVQKVTQSNIMVSGYKFGEDFEEKYTKYSRQEKIKIKSGYIENCKLFFPIENDDGQLIFDKVEYRGERIFLYGDFINSKGLCFGSLAMIKN